ncbi:hypothetical protein B296_00057158 [Ensete ventricosum]|uniref:Uncharacterized protein n=1 Tax=Ensete ventricosum TaxID=4639 RepID=A0A426XSG6_ENSVE|nr:hypothetical protein B296_00057158 [Ensete ventricosum]
MEEGPREAGGPRKRCRLPRGPRNIRRMRAGLPTQDRAGRVPTEPAAVGSPHHGSYAPESNGTTNVGIKTTQFTLAELNTTDNAKLT